MESKSESAQQRGASRSRQRDETRHESVGLARLMRAIGDCSTELASGAVKVAGGLLTDVAGSCLDPVDRLLGRGVERADRTNLRPARSGDYGFSRAVERAVDGVADTVGRSQQRFRDTMDDEHAPDSEAEERTR